VRNKLCILTLVLCVAFIAGITGCSTSNADSNVVAQDTTKPAPDNSEITTKVDASGVKTEERVFRNNPRISRVVVTTTKDGQRTTKVYSAKGEEKSLTAETEDVLVATGDKVADAAGFVADKGEDVGGEAKDVAGKTADKAEDVGDKTVDAAKKVGSQTADGAKKVGSTTASGAKKVGGAAASGAKKAGSAIKKIVP
jgi:hypothetical protein